MKNFDFKLFALSGITATALLAGCGASQPPIGGRGALPLPAQMRSENAASVIPLRTLDGAPGYKAVAPLLYVANIGSFNVTVYQADANDPRPLATITDGVNTPNGACIDGQGTLYVVNEPADYGWVSEYPLGKTTPSATIDISGPAYCAVDGKGNLWVTNFYAPNVTEYLKGSKKPHTVISKGLLLPIGIAIDRTGNLYVGNFSSSASRNNVVVYAPGSKSPSRTITNGITSPRGIAVDSQGTLYVPNIFQNNVTEYRSGQSDPFQTITDAMDGPTAVTVDKKGMLYVSNGGNNTIVEFAPRSLKPLRRHIDNGLDNPRGVAYYPPFLP